jgi:tetratricopeptide (TPR) repeat protein
MPDSGSSWYNLGQAYSYQPGDKNLQDAADALERTTKLVANWGSAHFELGRVYERMTRIDDAIARYREAVRCAPNQGTYRYRLGRILLQKGQKEEGQREVDLSQNLIRLNQKESQLAQKIKVFPKEPRYLFELGMIYKEMGDHKQAAGSFAAALQLNPKYPKAQEEFSEARRLATQQP